MVISLLLLYNKRHHVYLKVLILHLIFLSYIRYKQMNLLYNTQGNQLHNQHLHLVMVFYYVIMKKVFMIL
jgi:hypothetical protein